MAAKANNKPAGTPNTPAAPTPIPRAIPLDPVRMTAMLTDLQQQVRAIREALGIDHRGGSKLNPQVAALSGRIDEIEKSVKPGTGELFVRAKAYEETALHLADRIAKVEKTTADLTDTLTESK